MRLLAPLLTLLPLLPTALSALTYKAFDISSLLTEEDAKHTTYRSTAGATQPLESILASAGATSIKIRLWVNPTDGIYNTAYALRLAKRARAAGLGVMLNLHYSDTWADPGHQTTPAAWSGLGITALAAQVKSYTTGVMNTFADAGVPVQIVSVGNEIRAGLLWPLGSWENFGNIATLLKAGIDGVRASRSSATLVMLHTDEGYSLGTQTWFYDSLISAGFAMGSFDVMGVSYYPFWNAADSTLENFQAAVNGMAAQYGKRIVVQETDWPAVCSDPAQIPASLRGIGFSVAGQVAWMKKVADVVKAIPGGLGVGVCYWEPAWISNQGLGSSCEDNTLFSGDWSNANAPVAVARASVNMMSQI
ncbi:arabinogalactan endo-1,4-beta-galactosidase gala [Geopyxis carbonaria]|nr:arabinogalactan endo-1,4-beta-galactosidase gala [Geopyxis carbonaria]